MRISFKNCGKFEFRLKIVEKCEFRPNLAIKTRILLQNHDKNTNLVVR